MRSGAVSAPVVIGRDHLDSGSVASPYRETEAMRDGSDAIADWPILNALLNTAAGATWVSVHHGGGVGIGNSIHAGMVVLADGSDEMDERLERVLTTDPGTGVLRHVDAGYEEAIDAAQAAGLVVPMQPRRVTRTLIRDLRQVATPVGDGSPLRREELGRVDVVEDAYVLIEDATIAAVGAHARPRPRLATTTSRRSTAAGAVQFPGSWTVTPTRPSRATASRSSRCAREAPATRSCTPPAAASSPRFAPRARPAKTS